MAAKGWGSLRPASSLPSPYPFVKWVGGKSPLLPEILRHFPDLEADQTYFEPFLGGGAVFFALRPHRAVLSDVNVPLIRSYIAIRDNLKELTRRLSSMPAPVVENDYYDRRARFNHLLTRINKLDSAEQLDLAALFIWLNHTCFNGLYRVNKDGLFNAALGDNPDVSIYSEVNLRAVRRALRSADAKLSCMDYELALKPAREGDVVYLDPPYHGLDEKPTFAKYTANGFGRPEQSRLARVVHELVDRGCRVVMSSSQNLEIVRLYRDLRQRVVMAPRKINRDAAGRGKVAELIVIG